MNNYTVQDDNRMRRPAIDIAKEIITDGDMRGSAAKHATTILTRQVLEALVNEVTALRTAPAQGEPVAWRWRTIGCDWWMAGELQPLYAALPSSPASGLGSLNSGESEPSVMPASGAGEAISPATIAEQCAKIAMGHLGMYSIVPHKRDAYDEACRDIAKSIRDAHLASLPAPCTHPNAKVWFYRDDDTYMRCADCGSRYVGPKGTSINE